jgi:3'(2'), 5'-bisphosphate nucleotidase
MVDAVKAACQLCVRVQKELTDEAIMTKSDKSPVTIADLGAQAVVSHLLFESFPDIPIVGEEDSGFLRSDSDFAAKVLSYIQPVQPDIDMSQVLSYLDRAAHPGGRGLFWALDPIDGTKGFLRREQYAVCLGLIQDGEVLVAALGCPNLHVDPSKADGEVGCLFIGVRGQGAVQYDLATGVEKPISVSSVTDITEACYCESVESQHGNQSRAGCLAKEMGITRPPVRMDSQCKFAVVARGECCLYLRLSAKKKDDQKIWDIAPGAMIVEEAGGRVSDANGVKLNYMFGRTIGVGDLFASNGSIHGSVLEALQGEKRPE